MNQILISSKVYVTKELKRKQRIYQTIFLISILVIVSLLVYYFIAEKQKNEEELVSQDIRSQLDASPKEKDDTLITDKVMVVALNSDEDVSDQYEEHVELEKPDLTTSAYKTVSDTNTNTNTNQKTKKIKATNGQTYETEAILEYPRLGISYPILSEQNESLLKISLCKYWGPSPNQVGNYCIVGHNYASGKMLGKVLGAKIDDTFTLSDINGNTITYKVYDIYKVDPDDVRCTSQLTNGKKEVTLITCKEYGTKRLIVKARAI